MLEVVILYLRCPCVITVERILKRRNSMPKQCRKIFQDSLGAIHID